MLIVIIITDCIFPNKNIVISFTIIKNCQLMVSRRLDIALKTPVLGGVYFYFVVFYFTFPPVFIMLFRNSYRRRLIY